MLDCPQNIIHNIVPLSTGSSATQFIKDGVPQSLEKEDKK